MPEASFLHFIMITNIVPVLPILTILLNRQNLLTAVYHPSLELLLQLHLSYLTVKQ